ncbi:arsenic transporter [Chryseobacterium sp. GP-SGM7]|uniref:arsenic transporter n=1 Tax=Chryseobacterium sp. GP-SGM7 TaxID=3411323 RepID=UPI003B950CAC
MTTDIFIYLITLMAILGVIIRPFKIQESIWAVSGAVLLLIFGSITYQDAWKGIIKGLDVYLFLIGMMTLSESARKEGLFDWLASHAINLAAGSSSKLFVLIYLIGLAVTIFMSNDATAVVLTPAVAVAVAKAKIKNPLPYLLICAFIANAASFLLPISNPANLVIYGSNLPSLITWLKIYTLPSIISVCITFLILFRTQRKFLNHEITDEQKYLKLGNGGKVALAGIIITTFVLLLSSFLHWDLGIPTFLSGVVTSILILIVCKKSPLELIRHISWSVIPLVAGLFILVEAVQQTGIISNLSKQLADLDATSPDKAAWNAGLITAFGSNLINNLPAGLIAGTTLSGIHLHEVVRSAVLIGIDLGPNLSITGSLATILWIKELRKNGYDISAWQFLKLGILIMIPTLMVTLAVVILQESL